MARLGARGPVASLLAADHGRAQGWAVGKRARTPPSRSERVGRSAVSATLSTAADSEDDGRRPTQKADSDGQIGRPTRMEYCGRRESGATKVEGWWGGIGQSDSDGIQDDSE